MKRRRLLDTLFLCGLLVLCGASSAAQEDTQLHVPDIDRIRLAEAFRIADAFGDRVWFGWKEAPFAVLLVTPGTEFLIRHPRPSPDFVPLGYDSLLASEVYHRPRVFDVHLLATFPAVGGIPTIVIGQAENTESRTSSRWVLTIMHERFHQLQYHQPDYYVNVNRLDLSRGDRSGMWMLNYPFPYDSASVFRHFNLLARRLRETLLTEKPVFTVELNRYLALRREFKEMLSAADYRYFSFQLWQEGVARYTEIVLAGTLAAEYDPTPAFTSLTDYVSLVEEARNLRRGMFQRLRRMSFKETRRDSFYAFGAAEALLLDRVRPEWKKDYFSDPFFLERYFEGE